MKAFYIVILVFGLVLLLATESEYGQSNFIGLLFFAVSAYKLGLLDDSESNCRGQKAEK